MLRFRPADTRGHVEHGWLDSQHSFAFGEWQDRRYPGYGALRVINEDRVAPGAGFAPHSHADMEIISYVLDGGLRHRDSTGGSSVLKPGELQLMTAGRGISHSEMNASQTEPVHFLQIWIVPNQRGAAPGYQQKALDRASLSAGFVTVVAPHGEDAPFAIHADARLNIAWLGAGETLRQALAPERRHYLQVARGAVRVGEQRVAAGDALEIDGESSISLRVEDAAELLLFDLPA